MLISNGLAGGGDLRLELPDLRMLWSVGALQPGELRELGFELGFQCLRGARGHRIVGRGGLRRPLGFQCASQILGLEQPLVQSVQRLLETQNLRRSLEAKQPGQQPSANESMAAGAVQALKAQLESQLSQLARLQGTYGPQHPKIREIQGQIDLTRRSLIDEQRALAENGPTELARTKELEQKYIRAVAEQEAKVASLRQVQDEGSKLVLELDSARSVYKHALDGFDQIMFQAVANHTNVSVVSRAVAPLRASKPNKIKLLLMTLVAGLGLGVVAPLGYELFFDRRLRCRDDMEREFGIAVLAQLEAVPALARAT